MDLHLPYEAQKKLTCSECKKPLSRFPIYTNPDLGTSTCGRCPKPVDPSTFHNITYEHIASYNKFTCGFKPGGCLRFLFPIDVEKHETYCKYRTYDCALGSARCAWKGLYGEYCEHFEQEHVELIISDKKFEVDFVHSYEEVYLLTFGEDIFVLRQNVDAKSKLFRCNVTCISVNPDVENFYYLLTFSNGNVRYDYKVCKKVNGELYETSTDNIIKSLNNPSNVIAQIQITDRNPDEIKVENGTNSSEDENNDLDELFECPTCFEYLLSPIYQCKTGHSICGKCQEKVTNCPTCNAEFGSTRNFVLENIMSKKILPCKYSKCKYSVKGSELHKHQANCIYGPFDCPLFDSEEGCEISVALQELSDHILKEHSEHLLEFDIVEIPFIPTLNFKEIYIIKYQSRLFRLLFQHQDHVMYWSVQLVGSSDDCKKFKFEIDLCDSSEKNRVFMSGPCVPTTSIFDCFKKDNNYLYLEQKQSEPFVDCKLTYRVRIVSDE